MKLLPWILSFFFPTMYLALFAKISYATIQLRFNLPPIESKEFLLISFLFILAKFMIKQGEKDLDLN